MTWEERMAKKAAKRQENRSATECAESRAAWEAQKEEWVAELVATMTVEDALAEEQRINDSPPIWCACVGGLQCCVIKSMARKRVLE